jgi:hypothetical protein
MFLICHVQAQKLEIDAIVEGYGEHTGFWDLRCATGLTVKFVCLQGSASLLLPASDVQLRKYLVLPVNADLASEL